MQLCLVARNDRLKYLQHLLPMTAGATPNRPHEEGMAQWCVAAGAQRIGSAFALSVFEDVRWCIVRLSRLLVHPQC